MNKPKMRPITIGAYEYDAGEIIIEALTDEAASWVLEHAAEFGTLDSINSSRSRKHYLQVYRGYARSEVITYLYDLWDSQQWPEEIQEPITTDVSDTSHPASAT